MRQDGRADRLMLTEGVAAKVLTNACSGSVAPPAQKVVKLRGV
jgi:hypothetical protein